MMTRSTLGIFFFLLVVAVPTALAQRQAYVATYPGEGEEEPRYYLLHLSMAGTNGIDTLWFLDPAYNAPPEYPPHTPAAVWALFRREKGQGVQVTVERPREDSIAFHSTRFVDEGGNWMEFEFSGTKKGYTIRGILTNKTFTKQLGRHDTEKLKLTFRKAGVIK